ncbi:hypothetical protein [Cupriavidus basilensis]|nr:hypothetical protein [Cupriavidus basilensis]MDR3382286.1 hypothetical protein [Cupriavidus basilensis]
MIRFRITVDGRLTYTGLFRSTCDAILDAIDRGARTVSAVPA